MKARENPFRTQRLDRVHYRPQGPDAWPAMLERLAALDWRGAVVGPDGSGKTTLLGDLKDRLRADGYAVRRFVARADGPRVRWRQLRQQLRDLSSRDFVLFDGADHLSPWTWRRVRHAARSAAGLVITSHRPGLLPTWLETATSPALLSQIVNQLLADTLFDPPADLPEVYERHAGNLRDALRDLYDRWS